ncbi:hypothetical protein AAG570_010635 [Ranatra chinensis]|uniref:Fibronectin type-III domain-containing protein n=1 Tax=Ranatra chinensis TaxID=642074 RepID=A0ABD0Z973_9HEMI
MILFAENPLHCGCEQQELWEWLRDHQKVVGGGGDGVTAGGLRCEQPPELRGQLFLELEPPRFCSVPLVLKLAIQDIQPFSVVVSWQSRNHTGLHGYRVAYHALDGHDTIQGKLLDRSARSVRLGRLSPATRYLVCVLGNSNAKNQQPNSTTTEPLSQLVDSQTSRCTEVRTLEGSEEGASVGEPSTRVPSSLITRRLGLIVGCCLGFLVFVILVAVLSYMKVKKQRQLAKREQPQPTQDYLSYRHFSLQSADPFAAQHATGTTCA